jgi:hypothetical protein
MDPVSRADNLAQFMKLVGAARARNDAFSPFTKAPRPSASLLMPGASVALQQSGYSQARRVSLVNQSAQVSTSQPAQPQRKLGTRFDAYA